MPNIFVAPPQRKPRKGGIKSVIGEFVSVDRLPIGAEIEWISEGCEFPKAAPGLCYVANPVTDPKTFEGIEHGAGPIFGLYTGVQCFLGPDSDYEERARKALSEGEGRGVEEVLWEWAATTGGAALPATTLVDAIAQAEESADSYYIGQPVIMMSRRVAVWARSVKAIFGDEENGRLWTANGTPVIASAAASDAQLSIFGWPTVYGSDVTATRVIDHTVNQELAIAERIYAIAVDCAFIFTYTVVAPAGTSGGGGGGGGTLTLQIGTQPASPIPDGTDTTVTVNANQPVTDEVYLWYRINGGTWTDSGEMTEVTPTQFVQNVNGTLTSAGDVVDLYAKSGTTVSPTITVNVT
jgi:hypothetical protein